MKFIVKTTPEELLRAKKWWQDLEMQWKFAYNETVYKKGPTIEPPTDDELMLLLIGIDTLRFAGPLAIHSNMTTNLTNLSGLIPLYQLKFLSIANTQITSLKELVRHTQLEHLYVQENKITSLEGIEGMTNLKNLYCQHNKIESVLPIKGLTKLENFYCSNNLLTSTKGITKKHAKNGMKLYIEPNDHLRDADYLRLENKVKIRARKG